MLPVGGWATEPVAGQLLAPRDAPWQPLRASALLTSRQATYRAELDSEGANIVVYDNLNVVSSTVPAANPTVIDLAFDQLDRRFLTWQIGNDVFIHWFDPNLSAFTTTLIAAGQNPCCALDERRDALIQNSDILLVYQRADLVFYRRQRDRFLTEYAVPHNYTQPKLRGCGMATNLRFTVRVSRFIT